MPTYADESSYVSHSKPGALVECSLRGNPHEEKGMPAPTRAKARHLASLARLGRNPAATVYDSLGGDFFLAPAPGWLNLGLWEGRGDASEAPDAVVRLASVLAAELPVGRDIVDVANGLGAQDLVIRSVARPRSLVAVNITESQLHSGRARLVEASAAPLVADATALPLADDSADGIISIEAAFHFPSRHRFFAEARRVLRPGGVLSMSDVSAELTRSLSPLVAAAGLTNLRVWGIRRRSLMTSAQIEAALISAGFVNVRLHDVSQRVFPPAIRFFRQRLRTVRYEPLAYRWGSGLLLRQWELLAARDLMRYLLVRAQVPP
jgi:erythromycin 3''-O-methyltransferase